MKKEKRAKPINCRSPLMKDDEVFAIIECVGYKSKNHIPYIRLETNSGCYIGSVEPKDLKRLESWVRDCREKRK